MNPDATTLISTPIAIYAVFLSVFAGQVPAAVRHGSGEWKWLFIAGLAVVIGIGVDIIRILNSLGDLLGTTLRTLPPNKIRDAEHEAVFYFLGNLLLLILVLGARSRLTSEGQDTSHQGRHQG